VAASTSEDGQRPGGGTRGQVEGGSNRGQQSYGRWWLGDGPQGAGGWAVSAGWGGTGRLDEEEAAALRWPVTMRWHRVMRWHWAMRQRRCRATDRWGGPLGKAALTAERGGIAGGRTSGMVVAADGQAARRQRLRCECDIEVSARSKNWTRDLEVSKPAYIRWLTDEYRQAIAICPTPYIFVGATTSPMNIRGLYLSVIWWHWRIYGAGQSQTGWHIYWLEQTDKYNLIFISFGTNEWTHISCSGSKITWPVRDVLIGTKEIVILVISIGDILKCQIISGTTMIEMWWESMKLVYCLTLQNSCQ
jgi:hypothetical protein